MINAVAIRSVSAAVVRTLWSFKFFKLHGSLLLIATLLLPALVWGDELQDLRQDVEKLKEQIAVIEKKAGPEEEDGVGHKLHPVHTLFGARLFGGLTMIFQRSLGVKDSFGNRNDQADAEMSADFFLETPVGEKGTFLLRMDIERGAGLTNTPPLFNNPDLNTTGTNNDVETWINPESLNLNEARYQGSFLDDRLIIAFGHMDLTAYFDTNVYANKETFQFVAQTFNNNNAIDWGGDVNFFGPGLVVAYSPVEWLTAMGGWFHGGRLNNTDLYNRFFKDPWMDAEINFKPKPGGHPGNYRFYTWRQGTSRCPFAVNGSPCQSEFKKNWGVGLSFDQEITEMLGLWARFGTQQGDVAQFDRIFTLGAQITGAPIGRSDDVIGIAYGQTFISEEYRNVSGKSGNEHYLEAYYRFVAVPKALEFSPDVQFVKNPGGDKAVDSFYVFGFRAQVFF